MNYKQIKFVVPYLFTIVFILVGAIYLYYFIPHPIIITNGQNHSVHWFILIVSLPKVLPIYWCLRKTARGLE